MGYTIEYGHRVWTCGVNVRFNVPYLHCIPHVQDHTTTNLARVRIRVRDRIRVRVRGDG